MMMNERCKKEVEMASNWDKIPSIQGLSVDWDYEPESSLGKRLWKRLVQKDIERLLGVDKTPVKMITADTEIRGRLLDISQKGLGVLLEKDVPVGEVGKIGLHLGKETIVSRAVTKNSVSGAGKHRVGLEFVGLSDTMEEYIVQLVSSNGYKQL